jgi:hypothetical protein
MGGWIFNTTPQPLCLQERDPEHIVQEAGWPPGLVWTGAESPAPQPEFSAWIIQPIVNHYTD